ncbi:TonB-dependent receptor plug domain-containing protein [Maribellus comscasis]|uniref:TonB-dependent receptor plug domain-containing protein n=1 Tax=Maribellus comscasis TaxID=2681766 RepID=A0A6I6JWV2_9BACT|nr:TonB-dependent receptor [Maribellus comscasis]QGY44632.1 TonB-dependent receptor plug domain-containing protein [Maribellus comscasis]
MIIFKYNYNHLVSVFILAFLFIGFLPASGQKSITGIVKEKNTGETLPYASVIMEGTTNGTTTNADGYFTLFNIPENGVLLTVRFLGYTNAQVRVEGDDLLNLVVIEMEQETKNIDEIVVAARRNMMKVSDNVGQVSISPKQLTSLPSLGEKDIFRSMQLLPGVSGTNEASSGLYVRGGTPDQNLILFDGFTVYHVDHFYGFFSAFNANAIKDVQLYKGGFEPKFGGRTSSVVEITGKTGNENDFKLGAEVSSISANIYTEIPLWGKGSVLFAARRSYAEIIKSGLYEDIFDMAGNETSVQNYTSGRFQTQDTEPVFNFYDMNLKATYKPSDKDVISLSFYSGSDNLDNTIDFNTSTRGLSGSSANISTNTTDLTEWGNHGMSARWGRKWGTQLYSNTVVSYSQFYSNRDRTTSTIVTRDETDTTFVGIIQDNKVLDFSVRQDFEYELNANHNLAAGVHFTGNNIRFENDLNDTTLLDLDNKGNIYAAYLQDKWSLSKNVNLTFGARVNYFDVTQKYYFEPRIQTIFKWSPRLKTKAAWGIYNQFINRSVQEDLEQGSYEIWLLSDDEIVPVQSATHYILGMSYEADKWLFDVEAYYKDLGGLSELNPRVGSTVSASDDLQDIYTNSFFEGTGIAKGIEFLIQKKFGNYTGWIAYTLSKTEHRFDDIEDHPFPALHDQTHEIKLVNSYKWRKWTLAGTWVYATGKPYTAPAGGYSLTLLNGTEQYYVVLSDKNGQRLPAYHRLDVSATYDFKIGEVPASLGLSIFNLYNRANVWYKEFTIDSDNDIYAETNVNFIGFTPSLFFSIEF